MLRPAQITQYPMRRVRAPRLPLRPPRPTPPRAPECALQVQQGTPHVTAPLGWTVPQDVNHPIEQLLPAHTANPAARK